MIKGNHFDLLGHQYIVSTKTKLSLEKLIAKHPCAISASAYDSKDALAGVIAFLIYDFCNYYGVMDEKIDLNEELAVGKPELERIKLWRGEKIVYYQKKIEIL